jgi:hypothetical protein
VVTGRAAVGLKPRSVIIAAGGIWVANPRLGHGLAPRRRLKSTYFHGAVTHAGMSDTAVPHRDEGWNLVLPSVRLIP